MWFDVQLLLYIIDFAIRCLSIYKTYFLFIYIQSTYKNNPGIAVINSTLHCTTSAISPFIGHCLQQIMLQITSFIKEANNFKNQTNSSPSPENSIIVTMDAM